MIAARLRSRSDSVKALEAEQKSRLDRLRSSKSTIGDDLEKQRASTQFEPNPDIVASDTAAADAFGAGESKTTRPDSLPKKPSMGIEDEKSYTSRLLDAKAKSQ